MESLWASSHWETDSPAFEAFDREVGGAGMPVLIVGPCPFHRIAIEYAGYENFFLHLADFPDRVDALVRVMEQRYEDLWEDVEDTSAELVLHGAHWSGAMTPPPLFRRYMLPYFERFTDRMRRAGKRCAFHADADLSGLLDACLETGMDVADCFACDPLVPLTLEETRRAWDDRIAVWGAVPSTILTPECSERQFRAALDRILREVSDGRAFIAGVSDNLMPGSVYSRIEEVARRFADLDLGAAG
jgi:hypothetical protein